MSVLLCLSSSWWDWVPSTHNDNSPFPWLLFLPCLIYNPLLSNSYLEIYFWGSPDQDSWHFWHLLSSHRCSTPKGKLCGVCGSKSSIAYQGIFSHRNHRYIYSLCASQGPVKCLNPKTKGPSYKKAKEICQTKCKNCLIRCLQNVMWGRLVSHSWNTLVCRHTWIIINVGHGYLLLLDRR